MTDAPRPLMILIAGLYRSGTGDEPGKLEANVRAMNETALVLFRTGHPRPSAAADGRQHPSR